MHSCRTYLKYDSLAYFLFCNYILEYMGLEILTRHEVLNQNNGNTIVATLDVLPILII